MSLKPAVLTEPSPARFLPSVTVAATTGTTLDALVACDRLRRTLSLGQSDGGILEHALVDSGEGVEFGELFGASEFSIKDGIQNFGNRSGQSPILERGIGDAVITTYLHSARSGV